jgi:excisionase family DNA binding protein
MNTARPRALRISTVSRELGISETSARRLIAEGVIPAFRVGRQWRVDPDILQAWKSNGGSGGWRRQANNEMPSTLEAGR